MTTESELFTPQKASVRVTYGTPRSKASSLATLHNTSSPQCTNLYSKAKPRQREIDGDSNDEDEQDNPSTKKRLVQTSLFSAYQTKTTNATSISAQIGSKRSLNTVFPEHPKTMTQTKRINGSNTLTMHMQRIGNQKNKITSTASTSLLTKKEQTFLDFGQKPLVPEACTLCGMTFQRGREEDEALHNKFHRVWNQKQAKLLAWDISTTADDAESIIETVAYTSSHLNETQPEIIPEGIATVRFVDIQGSSKREVQRALDILNIVNENLGAVKLSYKDLAHRQRKIVLYISPKCRVEGCILAEMIENAYRVSVDESAESVSDSSIRVSTDPMPATCGISRIWVAPHARRRGIASQMVDALCRRFIYGCQLCLGSLAFSQPTADGRALAERIFGRRDFLVYAESCEALII
ncbi:hypothetical protein GGI25_000994 [Coemansia spiralis]|uniref:Uncharacterized protein n=2 Tax=Coemansia TaxID=4863 RepID=A0A9W8L0K0_9FUNG|nr:ESCO1/2 acetyl-transferase-domain-containing protein [Coemansia spiralis]KAJ1986797.1 hypothetical protein EDC05_006147 [Coemansia umbellata]KAJ2621647.1 hypothetical protein GGI26_003983 [Coemansia sp. RSA 1358]KAJ2680105.1 hypothetical protein GGI25_000994 [Coemansia spiralis]